MTEERQTRYLSIEIVARRTGLSASDVHRCIQRGLVCERLSEGDLAELRRIRRLIDLKINLAGVEAILIMHEQIKTLRAEIDRLRSMLNRP